MFGLRNAVDQERKTETEHASGFHSRKTLYLNVFMLIYFLTFNTYKYAFPLFPIYSFDNDDMKSSKRHAVLLSLIFLLKFTKLLAKEACSVRMQKNYTPPFLH